MNELHIHSQAELDAVPEDYTGKIFIEFVKSASPVKICKKYQNASVEVHGSATVRAYDSSAVRAYGSATVVAYGSATVVAYESATVVAYESATVEAYGSATVRAYGSATVEAYGFSQIMICSSGCSVDTDEFSRKIILYDIDGFIAYNSLRSDGNSVHLFKAVHKVCGEYLSDADNTFSYEIGKTAKEPNIDRDTHIECGIGIHLSGLRYALEFGKNWSDLAILEVIAQKDDIVIPEGNAHKVRASEVTVLREVPLSECGILGEMIMKEKKQQQSETVRE